MRRSIVLFILSIWFVFGISTYYVYTLCKRKPKVIVKKEIIKVNECKSEYNDEKIINWIYSNSRVISRKQAAEFWKIIKEKSEYPLLTLAIICEESHFDPTAISKSGAVGLMQILPTKYQIEMLKKNGIITEKRDLFDPSKNIEAGMFIFKEKLDKFGNMAKALNAYVGGSKKYVFNVLKNLGELYLLTKISDNSTN